MKIVGNIFSVEKKNKPASVRLHCFASCCANFIINYTEKTFKRKHKFMQLLYEFLIEKLQVTQKT